MKKIVICGKEYEINATAFTRFEYKKLFGEGIFHDINILNSISAKQNEIRETAKEKGIKEEEINTLISNVLMDNLDDFIDVIEKITFILIHTANPQINDFEDWLRTIEKIDLSASWISEVTEFAVASFC